MEIWSQDNRLQQVSAVFHYRMVQCSIEYLSSCVLNKLCKPAKEQHDVPPGFNISLFRMQQFWAQILSKST